MKVRFHYADRQLNYSPKSKLKEMVTTIFAKEQIACKQIDYIFCSDDYLLNINQNHLQHDYYTDIITFPLSDKDKSVEAEIYISIDRIKDNSKTQATTFKNELKRVIAHGALHLCGYKDKTKADQKQMRKKEEEYINHKMM